MHISLGIEQKYRQLVDHYDDCLARFGDTSQGADWPNETDRQTRFAIMLDMLRAEPAGPVELLDFACGTAELFRWVRAIERPAIVYKGVDLSGAAIRCARQKFPEAAVRQLDILQAGDEELAWLAADFCLVNGLFTIKAGLSDSEMWSFLTAVLGRLWPLIRRGLAFNVMSKQVDWERDDLFHVSLDRMAEFLHGLAGRRVTFRADYGLYEYTCYIWKEAQRGFPAPARLAPQTAPPPEAEVGLVCRPLLPTGMQILPYLEEIDRRRWYSNHGSCALALAERLAGHFGLSSSDCVTASSGTAALSAALIAVAGRATVARPYCLMPSYTFVATAAAALDAGYVPYFLDIDADSLALLPERVAQHPILDKTGAVIVVAPYGQPIAHEPWRAFAETSGIPVVIDAAASFDAIAVDPGETLGSLPVVLSLHATKVFGVGEGGLILCRDVELIRRCQSAMNFGFLGSREAMVAGFNGKMSEYHAAVGLAALDGWLRTRAAFLEIAARYHRAARQLGVADRIVAETAWASSYVLYRAETDAAAAVAAHRLSSSGIDFRLWYGTGCHRQPAYADFPRDELPVTERVAPCIIGLPVAVDLSEAAVFHTLGVLAADKDRHGSGRD